MPLYQGMARLIAVCLLAGFCRYSRAESCADVTVSFSPSAAQSRLQLTAQLATVLHRSVIGEYLGTKDREDISIPPNSVETVADFARIIGGSDEVHCVIEEQVIHLYQAKALDAKENAMNYVFPTFDVPTLADLFVIRFRLKLEREAFKGTGQLVSGSDAGGTGSDAEKFLLNAQNLSNIAARALLMSEARTVPMVFGADIYVSESSNLSIAWEKTNATMVFHVLR